MVAAKAHRSVLPAGRRDGISLPSIGQHVFSPKRWPACLRRVTIECQERLRRQRRPPLATGTSARYALRFPRNVRARCSIDRLVGHRAAWIAFDAARGCISAAPRDFNGNRHNSRYWVFLCVGGSLQCRVGDRVGQEIFLGLEGASSVIGIVHWFPQVQHIGCQSLLLEAPQGVVLINTPPFSMPAAASIASSE